MSVKYKPTHRAPDPYTVTFQIGGEMIVNVKANNPAQAKAQAMEIARDCAAQLTATAVIEDSTEAHVDDWCVMIPNRSSIKIVKDEVEK
jgi:hypothetical protein